MPERLCAPCHALALLPELQNSICGYVERRSHRDEQMEYFARRKKSKWFGYFEQTREEKHGPRCVCIAGTLGRAGSRRL